MLDDEPLTTTELLEQWRDATRAAELAERLAKLARVSVERSDKDSAAAQEIAKIAERAAKHAERTAKIAREAADRALAYAKENRGGYLAEAETTATESRDAESAARERYHEAERAVRDRQGDGLAKP
ncbi:MAG TPA: hypothetical protein VJ850_02725 [Candidatus Limnocylindrales bacterium]|nr:hypothetical protein [Candidatus Limnocylindrales bacterium]